MSKPILSVHTFMPLNPNVTETHISHTYTRTTRVAYTTESSLLHATHAHKKRNPS